MQRQYNDIDTVVKSTGSEWQLNNSMIQEHSVFLRIRIVRNFIKR